MPDLQKYSSDIRQFLHHQWEGGLSPKLVSRRRRTSTSPQREPKIVKIAEIAISAEFLRGLGWRTVEAPLHHLGADWRRPGLHIHQGTFVQLQIQAGTFLITEIQLERLWLRCSWYGDSLYPWGNWCPCYPHVQRFLQLWSVTSTEHRD